MDIDNRVERMDEELKLLKNEIKQVLLEVQEQVLSAQNPFSTTIVTGGPRILSVEGSRDDSPVERSSPPVTETSEPTSVPASTPAPQQYQPPPAPQQYQPPPVPQQPVPAAAMPQMGAYGPPGSPPPMPPAAPITGQPGDLPPEAPGPATAVAQATIDDVQRSEPDAPVDDVPPGAGREFKETKLRELETTNGAFQGSDEPSGEGAGIDEAATRPATDHEERDLDSPGAPQAATTKSLASADQGRDGLSPSKDRRREVVDLVT